MLYGTHEDGVPHHPPLLPPRSGFSTQVIKKAHKLTFSEAFLSRTSNCLERKENIFFSSSKHSFRAVSIRRPEKEQSSKG
jgi:hypothetical protein